LIRWAVLVALLAATTARGALENSDCFACHGEKDLVRTNAATKQVQSLYLDAKHYTASVHGSNLCVSCHSDIKELPHPEKLKKVDCGQCHSQKKTAPPTGPSPAPVASIYEQSVHGLACAKGVARAAGCADCHGAHDVTRRTLPQSKLYWQNIPATCGQCHEKAYQDFTRSIHGKAVAKGLREAPVCTDCHGEHTIAAAKDAASRVFGARVPETCGQCHGLERIATRYRMPADVVKTYLQSYHGLALQMGGVAAANCASCHGFHDVLPSSDPLSSIYKTNLPQTCGKCHPGIGTRLAQGDIRIHTPAGAAAGKPRLVNFVTRFYIAIIIITIGGMFLHNLLDFLKKLRDHIRAVRAGEGPVRLTPWMRAQHLILMLLFVALAYTGFVHKFPDAWWSSPFQWIANGNELRGMIHRVAGWMFTVFFVAHLGALLGTRAGRGHLKELWFRGHDLDDLCQRVAYNLGLRETTPPDRRWNYVEKSEYWALLWGSVIMIGTGILLIFTVTVLRLLPKVWLDVAQIIHYYEALLATLAIVVWHLYAVFFDPHEHPMNPAWLIGRKAPQRRLHPHASATDTATAQTPGESPADVAP